MILLIDSFSSNNPEAVPYFYTDQEMVNLFFRGHDNLVAVVQSVFDTYNV